MNEVETTTDLTEDLEELSAEYPAKPKTPRKPRSKKASTDEVEYLDDLTPETIDQLQVMMYRRTGSRGWWWKVKFPQLRTGWGGGQYWRLYEDSGYAITKWGAQYEIKKAIKRRVVRKEDRIEWTVPLAKPEESHSRARR